MNGRHETELVQRHYDELAGHYDRVISLSEMLLFGNGRRWVCQQASGDVESSTRSSSAAPPIIYCVSRSTP